MNKNKLQSGSAFVIIIIVLAVAIIGVLGFVFWQNFTSKSSTSSTDTTTVKTTTTQQPTKDDTELAQTATVGYGDTTMSLKYPKTWKVGDNTLTSADGKVVIHFTLTPPGGIGGTCGDAILEDGTITDPIVSTKWAAIKDTPKAIFSSYISHVKPSPNSSVDLYTYSFAADKNSDEIKNIKVGDSTCGVYAFAGYVDLKLPSGATLQVYARFTDLSQSDNSMRTDLTAAEIKAQFESTNGQVAESIIESISVK